MADRVLLTGASGFLGRSIIDALGHDLSLVTLGRSGTNQITADLSTQVPELVGPIDWVIHAAGHAHVVPRSATECEVFRKVNVDGTSNLLRALETIDDLKAFVFVSSISVYGCETGEFIDETHPLEGSSPYAVSKIEAESMILRWCESRGIRCTVLRLPLIAGAGAPGNLGKIIRAIRQGWYVGMGDGQARKSMVLASDVAEFLPRVQRIGGIYNLTDAVHPTMAEFETALAQALRRPVPRRVPGGLLKATASLLDWIPGAPINRALINKLSNSLTFSDEKARKLAGWNPRSVVAHIGDVV